MKLPSFIDKYLEKRYSLKDAVKNAEGRAVLSGTNVTHSSAMGITAYFQGVRIISETVGQLPLIEYRRINPRGKSQATDRKLYTLLLDEPNPEMDAISFTESLTGQAVMWGNAFAEIEWDMEGGMPVALWPLRSDSMKVGRDPATKELIYAYTLPNGTPVRLPAWRVWHMPGFSFDGTIGYDSIYLAREALGLSMAMEEFGSRFFGNGTNVGGFLEHPNKLGDNAYKNLKNSMEEKYAGLTNAHRLMILEEGMKYQQIGIPPENAQFLESRKFQVIEIARLLNVKPHLLMDLDRATFSNIEAQGIEHVTYTMMPWLKRWEQTCNRKLLLPSEKPYFFFKFLVNSLLRGDSAARAEYYTKRFYLGSLSPNDIRELENENPIDDPNGDKYYVQANMLPIDMAGKVQQPTQTAGRALINDAVKKITERDKANISRAYKKDPEKFGAWLEDYFRDFPDYVKKELSPLSGGNRTEE